MGKQQIKSKQRVADHGEVLTAEREVNAMINLVQHETERIDSRFLEPACGTGNFLAPILEKKLALVKRKYSKSQLEFERYAVVAVSSIYGIDILKDNVLHCQERLFTIVDDIYTILYKKKSKDLYRKTIRFILSKNIVWGDALSLKTANKKPMPIVFSQWALVRGSMIKRHDYMFEELIPIDIKEYGLFSEMHLSDLGNPVFIPKSMKDYPLTHFLELPYEATN
jgi:hypothetical protein